MPPYAKILLSVNGSDPVEGPLDVALGDVVRPYPESTAYWADPPAVWRIKSWPPDWPAPGPDWTYSEDHKAYEFIGNGPAPEIPISNTAGLFGKWLLDLVVMDGVLDGVQEPSLIASTGWRVLSTELGLSGIALWEYNEFDTDRLWPGELHQDFKKLEEFAASSGSGPIEASFVAGKQSTAETTAVSLCIRSFNPSLYKANNRTITFRAWIEATLGATCHLELYNHTDNVSVHTFTTTSAVGELKAVTMTVPGNLPNSAKTYNLRMWRSGGNPGDIVVCKSAYLEVAYS